MNILIAGCGSIGCKLAKHLVDNNHVIFGMRRNTSKLPSFIKPIQADLYKPLDQSKLPKNIDKIIFTLTPERLSQEAYQLAYICALENLIRVYSNQLNSGSHLIFVSSTSVYGQNDGSWVDENSITQPNSFNGKVMVAAEKIVLGLKHSLCLRFSGIYGENRTKLINNVLAGQIAAKNPTIYTNRIHEQDCVNVLAHLICNNINHRIILATDNQPVDLHTLHHWLAKKLSVDLDTASQSTQRRRAGSKRLSNKRLLNTGYQFIYPNFKSGYKTIISNLKS